MGLCHRSACRFDLRHIHDALLGETHSHRGDDPDLALQIQRSAMHLDERFGQRQAQASSLIFAIEVAFDLPDRLYCRLYVLKRDSDTSVYDLEDIAGIGARPSL